MKKQISYDSNFTIKKAFLGRYYELSNVKFDEVITRLNFRKNTISIILKKKSLETFFINVLRKSISLMDDNRTITIDKIIYLDDAVESYMIKEYDSVLHCNRIERLLYRCGFIKNMASKNKEFVYVNNVVVSMMDVRFANRISDDMEKGTQIVDRIYNLQRLLDIGSTDGYLLIVEVEHEAVAYLYAIKNISIKDIAKVTSLTQTLIERTLDEYAYIRSNELSEIIKMKKLNRMWKFN